jgi:hypothetical protein
MQEKSAKAMAETKAKRRTNRRAPHRTYSPKMMAARMRMNGRGVK